MGTSTDEFQSPAGHCCIRLPSFHFWLIQRIPGNYCLHQQNPWDCAPICSYRREERFCHGGRIQVNSPRGRVSVPVIFLLSTAARGFFQVLRRPGRITQWRSRPNTRMACLWDIVNRRAGIFAEVHTLLFLHPMSAFTLATLVTRRMATPCSISVIIFSSTVSRNRSHRNSPIEEQV